MLFAGITLSLETNLKIKQKNNVKALIELNGGTVCDFVTSKVYISFNIFSKVYINV
jgi:hypothetical protein